jgi:hypothetical protein
VQYKLWMLQKVYELRRANMHKNPDVLFVCEHGAAKSIIAATYFNLLAKQRGFPWTAHAAQILSLGYPNKRCWDYREMD